LRADNAAETEDPTIIASTADPGPRRSHRRHREAATPPWRSRRIAPPFHGAAQELDRRASLAMTIKLLDPQSPLHFLCYR